MNILLTGSSGFIGRHILIKLSQSGHTVTACVRNPKRQQSGFPNVNFVAMNFNRATAIEDWLPVLDENCIDTVINTVGIIAETRYQNISRLHSTAPSALFRASDKAGVQRIVQISALGVGEVATSEYHLSKLKADNVLSGTSMDWFILRPSLVYGSGAKSMSLFRAMAVLPVTPLIEGGMQKMQPVYIDDLVDVTIHCISGSVAAQNVIDVVGPDEISMKKLLQKQRLWLGLKPAKVISTPLKWVLKIMPLTRWLDEPALTAENLKMLQKGNTSDADMVSKALGTIPQSMDDVLTKQPASPADKWYARLYFMRPLLRLGLATVWVWAALVSAFFYPQAESYQLLQSIGLSGLMLPVVLYGSASMDFLLGMALFFYRPVRHILWFQIAVIACYTIVITLLLPEYWLHPSGEISKNIPMLLATLTLVLMEEGR